MFGAQCSPRHACPLKGALLMQVHDRPQGAPVLALAGYSVSLKRMQNHAPMHAWLLYVKMEGFSGIFLAGYCTASSVRRRVQFRFCAGVNFSRLSSREAASGLNPMAVKMSLSCAE